jgi:putative two-component system response regulator
MAKTVPATILIVDDEPSIRELLVQQLSTEYSNCITAHSAFDALNKIKRSHISLLLTDIMMPGMSGMELLRLVKKHDPDTAVIMITGVMDISVAVDSLRIGACDFITKPFDLASLRRAVEGALERRQLQMENRYYQQELEKKVEERTRDLKAALKDVEESYKMTLEALVTALDAREHETQAHSQRVRAYTISLAQCIGLPEEDLVHVGRGALLHDVGKIGVPDSILLKPGRLTSEEWCAMRRHPGIGYDILNNIKFLSSAAEIVLCHQERWDGTGYPGQLASTDIPLGARIFAVADTMDAMTSHRPYRKAMTFEVVSDEIRRCAGTQFDPDVVEAFLSVPLARWQGIQTTVARSAQTDECYNVICRK